MKKLIVMAALAFALLAAIPAVSLGGKSVGTEDSCAASFGVEDAQACGGTVYFTLRSRSYNPGTNETTCVYNVFFGNGQQAPWALYRTWSGNVACGPNG